MTRDEKIKHVSTLATTLGAAVIKDSGIMTAGAVSPWISMAVAILQETEARFPAEDTDSGKGPMLGEAGEPSDKYPAHQPDPAAVE